jgi:hypothetical protein
VKNETSCCECSKTAALVVGVAGACLVVAGLVFVMERFTAPPPVSQARAQERLKNLADVRSANGESLKTYGMVDAPHGTYRVPVETAAKWVVEEWRDPAAGRSNLIGRLDKATVVIPPPKSPFE